MKKAIYYLSLASYHNEPSAQYLLGFIYKIGIGVPKNMIKGIDYFIQSASNGWKYSYFIVGYIYQEGKYVTRNMKKSIHYYKKASTLNDQYAKNNLGIIYKKGLDEEKRVNIGLAISYFDEAIRKYKDILSMYNLSHTYIYYDQNSERINISIELLIDSSYFLPSFNLLCIALMKKHNNQLNLAIHEINTRTKGNKEFANYVIQKIKEKQLYIQSIFDIHYQYYKEIDYIYDFDGNEMQTITLYMQKAVGLPNLQICKITSDFYEGFGNDLL